MVRHCQDRTGCVTHDHGNCRICGVRLSRHWPAWSFDGAIWLCEACYGQVRDDVDAALDTAARDLS